MRSNKTSLKPAARLFVSAALLLGVAITPSVSFAAGPGGLAIGFGSMVSRIVEQNKSGMPFAGVSDPVSFRSADNINTSGFALRRDGAY